MCKLLLLVRVIERSVLSVHKFPSPFATIVIYPHVRKTICNETSRFCLQVYIPICMYLVPSPQKEPKQTTKTSRFCLQVYIPVCKYLR